MNHIQTHLLAALILLYSAQTDAQECNYEDLVTSLLQTKDNQYQLSRTFFPPVKNPPEFVKVSYNFSESGDTQEWYWSMSTSSFIHPPEILQFTSLFFAKPHQFYDSRVYILLFNSTMTECTTDYEKLQFLTQRVGYLTFFVELLYVYIHTYSYNYTLHSKHPI